MAVTQGPTNLAQKRFDEKYITAGEIAEECKVSRTAVFQARKRGLLPDPITVGKPEHNMVVWERASVRPRIDAWKTMLQVRRKELA